MTPEQIAGLEGELARYLERFDDCFGRSEPRGHLLVYVRGQLSDMRRKSVEPIALRSGVAPRTHQKFLSWSKWDHDKLRDRVQQIVATEHSTHGGVLIVDETSHKKKGDKTPDATPIERALAVGFSRFPIERSFQDGKSELGLSHYEGRTHIGLIRHCHVTMMTHLFLARQTERLRGEKTGSDDSSNPQGRRRGGRLPRPKSPRTPAPLRQGG